MTIKFIPPAEVLPLRSLVLRNGKLYGLCVFKEDERPDTIHLGMIDEGDNEPKCILTAFPQKKDGYEGIGYQLRGMATHPDFQGRGLGNQLVNFLAVYLKGQQVSYLWCNAREIAFRFYQNLGFEFVSDEFEVPEIGLHRVMYLRLR
ncbi:GNAT family N-acetyltransferase [Olivibacter sp. SDN3]|nr:GNAT family N-acetyltransferase [Olivibacter sp. SDN3]